MNECCRARWRDDRLTQHGCRSTVNHKGAHVCPCGSTRAQDSPDLFQMGERK